MCRVYGLGQSGPPPAATLADDLCANSMAKHATFPSTDVERSFMRYRYSKPVEFGRQRKVHRQDAYIEEQFLVSGLVLDGNQFDFEDER